jgi:hypothetical protein
VLPPSSRCWASGRASRDDESPLQHRPGLKGSELPHDDTRCARNFEVPSGRVAARGIAHAYASFDQAGTRPTIETSACDRPATPPARGSTMVMKGDGASSRWAS